VTATTRTFNAMLNDYLPNSLFAEEMVKRDYILSKVDRDDDWKTGDYIVPFRGAYASSVAFGALTSATDVAESAYVRGSITTAKEVWGTLVFNQRDLMEHDGKIPESTFLKILPDEVDRFMDYLRQVVSVQLGSGPHFATLTADGDASGHITVDKIDRFTIGQKVALIDGNTATASYYVTAINVNSKVVTLSATRGGSAADVSAYTTGQSAKVYHPGVSSTSDTFVSMRQAFLSAANGGDTNLHGTAKTAYPILQAVNVDGSSINATNILDKIFDAYTEVRARAKGNATDVLVSFKHLGSIMKILETQKGSYRVTKDAEANLYGWTTITIGSVKGNLNIVGLQEMDDDIIPIVDWSSMKFATNGFFKKRTGPNGNQYFEVRNTTGYQYLVDVCLFGEMAYPKVGQNGIIYSVPNY
jgi:hypothetical protein